MLLAPEALLVLLRALLEVPGLVVLLLLACLVVLVVLLLVGLVLQLARPTRTQF
jgi:hypothetical protein